MKTKKFSILSNNDVELSHEHTSYAWILPSEIQYYNFSEGIKKDFLKVDSLQEV